MELEPQQVWNYFHELTQIPRPSNHEEKIRDYVENFGKSLGLETIRDAAGNIIIRKPATSGMENRKGVILQGHLDMVPQKTTTKPTTLRRIPLRRSSTGNGCAPTAPPWAPITASAWPPPWHSWHPPISRTGPSKVSSRPPKKRAWTVPTASKQACFRAISSSTSTRKMKANSTWDAPAVRMWASNSAIRRRKPPRPAPASS